MKLYLFSLLAGVLKCAVGRMMQHRPHRRLVITLACMASTLVMKGGQIAHILKRRSAMRKMVVQFKCQRA